MYRHRTRCAAGQSRYLDSAAAYQPASPPLEFQPDYTMRGAVRISAARRSQRRQRRNLYCGGGSSFQPGLIISAWLPAVHNTLYSLLQLVTAATTSTKNCIFVQLFSDRDDYQIIFPIRRLLWPVAGEARGGGCGMRCPVLTSLLGTNRLHCAATIITILLYSNYPQ